MWTCQFCDNDIDVEWLFDDICPSCKYTELRIEIGLLRDDIKELKADNERLKTGLSNAYPITDQEMGRA